MRVATRRRTRADAIALQVLSNGKEVKLQRNALSVLEAPSGYEEVRQCMERRVPQPMSTCWQRANRVECCLRICRTTTTRPCAQRIQVSTGLVFVHGRRFCHYLLWLTQILPMSDDLKRGGSRRRHRDTTSNMNAYSRPYKRRPPPGPTFGMVRR